MEERSETEQSKGSEQLLTVARLRRALQGLMDVQAHRVVKQPAAVITFRGRVVGDPEAAFKQVRERFADLGYTVWLRESEGDDHELVAVQGSFERKPSRVWINVALFAATLLSVLYVGAGYALSYADMFDVDAGLVDALLLPLRNLHMGIPFAATLLGILLAHELSHYFVARRYGSPVSLPFFIPLPMPDGLGTMGAVIVQRAPMRNRKALFDIGIAGPLGGLILAIPLLILGLALSEVGSIPPEVELVRQEGNSLLYLALKYLVFGRILPSGGVDVWLHPVAFAAWAGLLVTMLNLIPVGQLDGGHISYALLGRWAHHVSRAVIFAMLAWGALALLVGSQGGSLWIMWGVLNLFVNRHHPPPIDDLTRLDWPRVALGVLMLVLFILLFMPAPMQVVAV